MNLNDDFDAKSFSVQAALVVIMSAVHINEEVGTSLFPSKHGCANKAL